MAVQAQHPSNVLLLDRREPEKKEMEFPGTAPGLLDQSLVYFANANGANGNPMKRAREVTGISVASQSPSPSPPPQGHPVSLFVLEPQPASAPLPPPTLMSLAELQSLPRPFTPSGLRLALEGQNRYQSQKQSDPLLSSSSSVSSSLLSALPAEEFAARINRHKDEIEQYLHTQGEQLRRTLAEKHQKHYRVLLCAAEESAARRLREKELEVQRAQRRSTELEDRLACLRTESMAWQAKAMADQATALSLHAQLQHAASAAAAAAPPMMGGGRNETPPAEEAGSAYVDPDRVEPERSCRACRRRAASVVLLPCRHLCLCDACDAATAAESCPVCRGVRTGSIQVCFS
ncbi:hypothetical protein OPV22_030648 [Ensete ventricosum]|uniref:RING-type domain-containing protein n=1 Tax=Ensete ventricosum TaxID=4639 RepID=A0AAV8QEM9_ENSVE|nr:hypothetical protein OPV22_030648 [Ensete ventricosum]